MGANVVEPCWPTILPTLVSLVQRNAKIEIVAKGVIRQVLLELLRGPDHPLKSGEEQVHGILQQKNPKHKNRSFLSCKMYLLFATDGLRCQSLRTHAYDTEPGDVVEVRHHVLGFLQHKHIDVGDAIRQT